MANRLALSVFLGVELMLLCLSDISAVSAGIGVVLRCYCAIRRAKRPCLRPRDFALSALRIDPRNLVMLAGKHFTLSWVTVRPTGLG